jgi:hypothetical protein
LERAWERTRRLLLQPFDAETWIVIGFGAFVAGLAGGGWTGVNWRLRFPPRFDYYVERPFEGFTDVFAGPVWFLFGSGFVIFSLAFGVALLWVSSRGKFIFLDNMLHERGAIVEPWKRFGRLGNSLFLWRLGYLVALLIVFGVVLAPMVWFGREIADSDWMRPIGAATIAASALLTLVFGAIVAYVALFLDSFIVPLMYRGELSAMEAWRLFLPLLRSNPADFVIYGLLVLFAFVALALSLVIAAIVTCCIVPLLLSIPFVSTVFLLPLHGVYRLYSVEFLEQFGAEWTIGPSAITAAPPTPPPAAARPEPPPEVLPDSDGQG